ncbi:hypothetical protein PBV87_01055 [Niameybacter massiliensis]|uniref:Uncharacterized protein n=1 Tax=Holtiella tumoricola TaxID=3018743 RepID=A0AA42DJH0_9FIRM|nr:MULTISPECIES: hypothetical protein [Lachnospirales]MDA3730102.1 hypothetical protein [Holtiella tumoricola]
MAFVDHPAFAGINKNFLITLERTLRSIKDPSQLLPAMMTISNEAQRYNVQMTPERQQALMVELRNSLPPSKRTQFDAFIRMMQNNM